MTDNRTVYVVTDSASDLTKELREEYGIGVVPLSINFETESFLDGVDITRQEYIEKLRSSAKLPSTAQPTVEQFANEFRKGLDAGMDVVCITLSSGLSGTNNAARLAAEQCGTDRVRVVDSHAATMQMGWMVVEAARAANSGATLEETVAVAEAAFPKSFCFAVLQTLDYVYKGGRIGKASHMAGSALGIKPIVGFDHVLVPYERVRTWKKALARAVELASSKGNVRDLAILHTDNLEDAMLVKQQLMSRFPDTNCVVGWVGPTVSTYAGPGGVGIMVRVD